MWPCGCMLPPITPKLITGWPSLVRKAGMMVWNGRLPGATTFGLAGVEAEAVAAVLQAQAVARHHHARAEAHVVALDEADHHAALVGGGQVDGAALDRRCRRRSPARASGRSAWRARPGRPASSSCCGRHLHRRAARPRSGRRRRRPASSPRSAGAAQAAPSDRQRGEVEVLQDAQRHQRGDALAVGRDLVQRVAAVVLARSASTHSGW